jgi:hypothetical protein
MVDTILIKAQAVRYSMESLLISLLKEVAPSILLVAQAVALNSWLLYPFLLQC